MMRRYLVSLILFITIATSFAHGSKILAICTLPFQSHWIGVSPLLEELAARGHEVTVISRFPSDKKIPNYTVMPILPTDHSLINLKYNQLMEFILNNFDNLSYLILDFITYFNLLDEVENLLKTNVVQELIHGQMSFDLIIQDHCVQDAFLGFTHTFNAPSIMFSHIQGGNLANEAVGNPYPASYVPSPYFKYSDHMSFFQRLVNTLCEWGVWIWYRTYHYSHQNNLMHKYFTNHSNIPNILDLYYKQSAIFLNSHESLYFSRPLLPNVIQIGGIHIQKRKQLPAELKQFMDNAPEGIIYVSMGSQHSSKRLSKEKIKIFLDLFSTLKQKTIFKINAYYNFSIPKNVLVYDWTPQNDILAHTNTKIFISHGGTLGVMEAVNHGVPIIGIPSEGNTMAAVAHAETYGFGIKIVYANITKQSISWAIKEIMNNPRYRDSAKRQSILFKDRPFTPLQTAVYWTEYVLKHKEAPHLRSAALDLSWYQYYLLDVITVIVCIIFTIGFVCVKLSVLLLKRILQNSQLGLLKKLKYS